MNEHKRREIPNETIGRLGYAQLVDAEGFKGPANLAMWFLRVDSNMPWNKYLLFLAHLRNEPGLPKAVKDHRRAKYELILAALDPARNPQPQDVKS